MNNENSAASNSQSRSYGKHEIQFHRPYNLEVALLKYLSFIGPCPDYLAFPFKMLRLPRVILTFVFIFDINAGVKNKLNVGQIDIIQMTTGGDDEMNKMAGLIGENCILINVRLCFKKILAEKSQGEGGFESYRPNADKKFESFLSRAPNFVT